MTVEEWKRKNPPIRRKSITNADHIRAMTDKELAEFLSHPRSVCPKLDCDKCEEDDCHVCMLEWLQKEAKDDE